MRFLFFIIGSMLFIGTASAQATTFSQQPFTDVAENSTNFQAIEYLRAQNVLKGYMDGTFRSEARINRAEFVEFVINPFILDTNGMGTCIGTNLSDTTTSVYFSDVSKNSWYAENVCFAKNKEIIDGYPDGTFRPANSINFVEAAKIISNVFNMNIAAYQTGEFWYRPYVQSLSDLHAIPMSIRRFDAPITRGEMAQIVYRLKVDSTEKTSMGFDRERNVLFQRNAVTPVATEPEVPVVTDTAYRPTRRSIIAEYDRLIALRTSRR